MPRLVGLLRAVNLGPHNRIAMRDLLGLVEGLGLTDGRTLLQSGNVVFRGDARTPAQLERAFEAAAKKTLDLETHFFVRTAEEWRAAIAGNPFPKDATRRPGHLILMCLKDAPDRAAVTALEQAIKGREVVRASGRHAYFVYPDGMGRSRLTTAVIEKHLGTRGTARNWNTVLKLGALVDITAT
jgi:uncharacterized protein (DUF1697 family)